LLRNPTSSKNYKRELEKCFEDWREGLRPPIFQELYLLSSYK